MAWLFLVSFWTTGKTTFSVHTLDSIVSDFLTEISLNMKWVMNHDDESPRPLIFLIQFFSGTEHSGIDDLILDVSQASYTNGEYVDAKEWF